MCNQNYTKKALRAELNDIERYLRSIFDYQRMHPIKYLISSFFSDRASKITLARSRAAAINLILGNNTTNDDDGDDTNIRIEVIKHKPLLGNNNKQSTMYKLR